MNDVTDKGCRQCLIVVILSYRTILSDGHYLLLHPHDSSPFALDQQCDDQ
jgi:hypothetical protein